MKRWTFNVAITVALPILPLAAFAQDAPVPPAAEPASPWVGSLTLVSDYLFRGLSQTDQKPALQGSLEYDSASGFYAGFWGSSISWLSDTSTPAARVSSDVELDFYVGYRGKFSEDFGYDAGLYTYYYPGTYPTGFTRANTTEIYGALSFRFVSIKYSHALTDTFGFADTKNSGYLDLCANYEFAPSWVLNAHAGHQRIDGISAASYSDYKLGVTKNFDKGFSVALAYFDTDADRSIYSNTFNRFLGRSTGVLTLSKTF
jgi:uncharacterized protein (TIGR02001 family)